VRRKGVALLVHNIDAPGGMERRAAVLAEAFARLGRRVAIVSTCQPRGLGFRREPGEPPRFERRRGVLVYRIPLFRWCEFTTALEIFEVAAAWVLRRHAGWVGTLYALQATTGGLHASWIAPAIGTPVVLTLECSGQDGDVRSLERRSDADRAFAALRVLDRTVYLNDEARDEALGAGFDPARLLHIPNGVDVARFEGEREAAPIPELGPAEGRELVLAVGRLAPQKRFDNLLRAFAALAPRRPRARLAIVGTGPDRAALEALTAELGLGERVAFLGVREDIPKLLRAASLFALPSAWEGLSIALLEALSASVPVVASDIPGNRMVVRHEREGLLVPVDDVPALASTLERLLADRALAERLSAAGLERVHAEFSVERAARECLALFDALPRPAWPPLGPFLGRELARAGVLLGRGVRALARFARKRISRAASRWLHRFEVLRWRLSDRLAPSSAKPTRVAVVLPAFGMGGVERCAALLFEHLDRSAFRPDLIVASARERFYELPQDVRVHVLEDIPDPWHDQSLPLPPEEEPFREEALALERDALRLARVVRREGYRVVLAGAFGTSILAGAARRYLPAGTRVLGTIDAHLSSFLPHDTRGERQGALVRRHVNRLERVIAVSPGVREDLVARFEADPAKVVAIANPIDVARIRALAQEPLELPAGDPVLLYVGRLEPLKGVDLLVRAVARARREVALRCVIVGDGSERARLETLARELGVADAITFAGSQANPFRFLRRARALALPSRSESFGYVLVEALACGCPVVATDVASGSARDILDGGRAGLLVPVDDEEALSRAIVRLFREDALREELTRKGLARAEEFDVRRLIGRYAAELGG
jgi:glycosyltransferase involved in cell wall biosynthesis